MYGATLRSSVPPGWRAVGARPVRRQPEAWERDLAGRLGRRDPGSLEELYERFGRIVFGFLMNALRDRGHAEDVQQHVFLDVWRRADTYDPSRSSLLTWLMMIARSRAIDQHRRKIPEPSATAAELSDRPVPASDASDLDALVETWRVAGLLGQLPAEESRLLRMRFYEDLPQSQIALRTGIPLGTVKMRMAQGLRRLRDLIEEDAP